MAETPPSHSHDGESRGARSMVWWLAAALVIGVAVAGGIWVVVTGPDSDQGASPAPSTSVPPATRSPSGPAVPSSTAPTSGSGCTDRRSTVVPAQAPATEWKLTGGVALPFSAAFGPGKVQDPLATCFEHSATGALFAAAQISIRIGLPGREQVFRDQVLPGPTREQLLKAPPAFLSAPFPQWSGFRILASSTDQVTVQLVQRFNYNDQSVLAAHTLQMKWVGDDWKWEIDPPSGYIQPIRVTSLSGFVQWAGA